MSAKDGFNPLPAPRTVLRKRVEKLVNVADRAQDKCKSAKLMKFWGGRDTPARTEDVV